MIASCLLFCAGVDADLLARCPRVERLKYLALGLIVLLTGGSAFLSSAYALTQVFASLPAALACGALFGAFVFTLDRYLLTTWKPAGGVRMLWQAAPRLVVAALLALVIAKPLEIRIVHDRIARTLVERRQALRAEDVKTENAASGFTDAQKSVERGVADVRQLDALIGSDPPGEIFQSARRAADRCDRELASLDIRVQRDISRLERRAAELRSRLAIADVSEQSALSAGLAGVEAQAAAARNLLARKASECRTLSAVVADQRREHAADLKQRRLQASSALSASTRTRDERAAAAEREIARDVEVSNTAFGDNLVAELEALSDLSARSASVFWIDWMLTLLFLSIDTAPVVMKMMAGRGPYDDAVEAENVLSSARHRAVIAFHGRRDVYADLLDEEQRASAVEHAIGGYMHTAVRFGKRMQTMVEELETVLQNIVKMSARGGDDAADSARELIVRMRETFRHIGDDSLNKFAAEMREAIVGFGSARPAAEARESEPNDRTPEVSVH